MNKTDNDEINVLKEYCSDIIKYKGKYFYEFNQTAKNILKISNDTLKKKLKYTYNENVIEEDDKKYISHDSIIINLKETNQLFAIPILEKLNFIKRKTVYKTRALGTIPFSKIVDDFEIMRVDENGDPVSGELKDQIGLRDELLFLDSIVYTLKYLKLDWPGNLEFQCTKLIDGYRYDLYIKCSKICIEYNEYKSHHTSDNGISNDDEKSRITNSEGYLLLNFNQIKKENYTDQSTLKFIKDLLPIIRERRYLYDMYTPDDELFLDFLDKEGIDKDNAKLLQELSLHKYDFKLTLENAMTLMCMDNKNNKDINKVLNLVKKLDEGIWKCDIDGKLTNNFTDLNIENCRLNHRGFVKVAILVNTRFSHQLLDYYMKIDEICNKLFNIIRQEQKEFVRKIDQSKNSYKSKQITQKNINKEIMRLMKKCHNKELENNKAIISLKNKILLSIKPLYNFIKSSNQNDIDNLPLKFKNLFNKIRSKFLVKTDYENIKDGDVIFEEAPNLVYSQFCDDYITFKNFKELWNCNVLTKKKNIVTYKEIRDLFSNLKKSYPNINIEIQDNKRNRAHNIDILHITNIKIRENYDEDEDDDDDLSITESLSGLEIDNSDDEDTEN